MKIVKINKRYRNGSKEHFLVLLNEPYTDDAITELAEDWCESTPEGANYGYQYKWEIVEDTTVIKTVISDEIGRIDKQIEQSQIKKSELEKYL